MCVEGAESKCMPYKDPCLITAQILSILALILSFFNVWVWWAMLLLGFPAFIMIQTTWCCAMNKCGLITAGILALVGAGIVLTTAIIILVWLNNFWSDCDGATFSHYYDQWGNTHSSNYDCDNTYNEDTAIVWMCVSFISSILWFITGILVLTFACGKRYQAFEDEFKAEAEQRGPARSAAAIPVAQPERPLAIKTAVPIAMTMPIAPIAGTTTRTITNLPDGSVETKTEVVNPDGSRTVTVVVEKPMEDV